MIEALQSHPLAMDRFPLWGRRLIEASAGTGKTYTIAGLYLRLLLGHGPEQSAHARALAVDEILVVTFTEAATAELRQRIRQRISEARLAFARNQSEDPFIQQLLEEVSDHKKAFGRLDRAQKQMDEAAVFTIHGFCARMLKEHAFESGSLFEQTLVQEVRAYQEQAVRDFWRRSLQGLGRGLAAWVRGLYSGPEALLGALGSALGRPELKILPEPKLPLPQLLAELEAKISQLQRLWLSEGDEIEAELRQTAFHGNKVRAKTLDKHLQAMHAFARNGLLDPETLAYINVNFLGARLKKGAKLPEIPALQLAAELNQGYRDLELGLPVAALEAVRSGVISAKREQAELSFDDLLSQLDSALDAEGGEVLAGEIAGQYPVAMIDEFQDTDPIQFRIFDSIYSAAPDTALLMIGDPKQAIYAFRGADIATYLSARASTPDHYNLDTNWRSATALIKATNLLFKRQKSPFLEADIPFWPVKAAGKADNSPLTVEGQSVAPLQFWFYQESRQKEAYQRVLAEACAGSINRMLQLGAQGQALIGDRPVKAGDLAVLVRTGREAELIRQCLAEQGVRSVYLSSQDNVFAQPEARELLLLLQAALTPRDERKVRAAFATRLFDLPLAELDRLNEDELALEQALESAAKWQQLWRRQGVRPMLRRLLVERGVAASLLRQPLGERRLTDLLHLGELLQEAAQRLRTEHGLVRWLHEQIEQGGQVDGAQLRLESDSALVKVVTIHKSKGLEYPLVWLPFAMSARKSKEALYHRGGDLVLDLNADSSAQDEAERERLAEDLRLLYVALTRARHACFIGLYPGVEKGNGIKASDCALGVLLQGPGVTADAGLEDALEECASHAEIALLPPPQEGLAPWREPVAADQALEARAFKTPLQRNWTIASYSRLVQGQHSGWLQPGVDLEVLKERALTQSQEQPALSPFGFPRGARWGTFLHHLFEELDFRAPDMVWVEQECLALGLEPEWAPVVQQWVTQVLATVIDGEAFHLGLLASKDKWVELEFLLPLKAVDAAALNDLLRKELGDVRLPPLDFEQLQGMLTGFIDLTFFYQGRYYLLDYKSNYLGADFDAYGASALDRAMAEHRYDLQALLYTLALHRLLCQRLPDYCYEQHIGGAFYLFLRGLNGRDNQQGVWFERPDQGLIEQLEELLLEPARGAC